MANAARRDPNFVDYSERVISRVHTTAWSRDASAGIVGRAGLVIKSTRAASLDNTKSIVTRARTRRCSQRIIPLPLPLCLTLSLSFSSHRSSGPATDSHFRGRLFRTSCNNQISLWFHASRQLIAMKTHRADAFPHMLPQRFAQINRRSAR